jgi:hypothetical protein
LFVVSLFMEKNVFYSATRGKRAFILPPFYLLGLLLCHTNHMILTIILLHEYQKHILIGRTTIHAGFYCRWNPPCQECIRPQVVVVSKNEKTRLTCPCVLAVTDQARKDGDARACNDDDNVNVARRIALATKMLWGLKRLHFQRWCRKAPWRRAIEMITDSN